MHTTPRHRPEGDDSTCICGASITPDGPDQEGAESFVDDDGGTFCPEPS